MLSETQRDRVAELVRLLAADDTNTLVPLIDEFGGCLAANVRRHLRSLYRDDVADDYAQVDELVQEAALVIFDHASSWSPDGALPWTWADLTIRERVVAHLGHPSVEFEPERHDEVAPAVVVGPAEEFVFLARRFPEIGLLVEAIDEVGSERDSQVHIQFQVQKAMGDPSPALTVAPEFGLSPDNVRQINRRVRVALQKLIDTDERYQSLAALAWTAA